MKESVKNTQKMEEEIHRVLNEGPGRQDIPPFKLSPKVEEAIRATNRVESSIWRFHKGSGELKGQILAPIVSGNHFWFAWAAFKPETRIWEP